MQLDFPTLFIIILLNAFSLAVVWSLIVLTYRDLVSARYWLAAVLLKCVSGPLLFYGYGVTGLNYIGLTLVTLSFALVWQGTAAFYDIPRRPVWVGAITAGTLAALLLLGTSQITINIIAAVTQVAVVGMALRILLRPPERYIGNYVAALAAGLLIAGQSAEAATNMARLAGVMSTDRYYAVGAWFLVCAIIGGNISNLGFLLMTMNRAQEALLRLAGQDDLTGLPNRRGLRAGVTAFPVGTAVSSVLVLDLDRFKRINDSFGHDAGDKALLHITRVVTPLLKEGDILARLGGDEFCIVLPGVDHADALSFVARLTETISSNPFIWHGHSLDLSISVGLCEWDARQQPDISGALIRADQVLIETKGQARTSDIESGNARSVYRSAIA